MQVTLIKTNTSVRLEFEDCGYVLGDETGGLLENTAELNNEAAQELLERFVNNEPGEYEV